MLSYEHRYLTLRELSKILSLDTEKTVDYLTKNNISVSEKKNTVVIGMKDVEKIMLSQLTHKKLMLKQRRKEKKNG